MAAPQIKFNNNDPLSRPFQIIAGLAAILAVSGLIFLLGSTFFSKNITATPSLKNKPVTEKIIWVQKDISQCSEAWHEKGISLEKYLTSLGIEVFDKMIRETQPPRDLVCQACDCPSGETLYLKINKSGLADLADFSPTEDPNQ